MSLKDKIHKIQKEFDEKREIYNDSLIKALFLEHITIDSFNVIIYDNNVLNFNKINNKKVRVNVSFHAERLFDSQEISQEEFDFLKDALFVLKKYNGSLVNGKTYQNKFKQELFGRI